MAAAKGKRKRSDDEEGGIGYILKASNGFQASFSSAPTPSRINVSKELLKLNDHVYELCKPSGRPSVEVVFFHGFQLGGSRQTYATTWLSRNGSELWPNWIRKSVPEVRILLVSYDGSATKKDDRGGTDMYVTSENLLHSLTAAQVGQDGCPVILVGHSLGGLVIKEILLEANKVLSFDNPENPNWRVRSFIENVKQLFYYSCPHNGTRLADYRRVSQKGELFKLLRTLNKKAARRNEEFCKLRKKFKWGAFSIAEKLPTDLGSLGKQVVVEEASARHDTDSGSYYTVADADHFSVCQPASDIDSSFSKLWDIIDSTRIEVVGGHQIEIPTTLFGLNYQITQVTTRLRTTRYLSICGIGGIGKSTLAMAVYNAISGNFEYTSFVSEVKKKLVGEQGSTENLQEEILRNLYYKGNKSNHKWDRLKGKKVLIILDDVENESQVFVLPKTDRGDTFFSDESCVLVTCRNRKIVSSKDFEVHDAQFLDDEASRKLFCCHAFKEEHARGALEDHVEKFIAKCDGLPLALEVTGKYLYKEKKKAMWSDAFKRLSAAQSLGGSKKEDRLWSIFEVIYEDLQEEERQMFLDIATCFHGEGRETANLVWRSCNWVKTADVGWQNLVDIGFVKGRGVFDREIWMHELLRDFGRRKANPGNIESNSRVCCYEDINGLPPWPFQEGTTPLVKFLRIVGRNQDRESGFDIDIERLRGLENLKVLLLEGVKVHGAFNLLPDNLEVLIMRRCWWTPGSSKSSYDAEDHDYIPSDGWCSTLGESSAPKSGQHVSLRHMDFLPDDLMYGGPLFPDQSFEHLPTLKYLRISVDSHSSSTITLQADRAAPDCPPGSLPDSLGQLKSLQELDICWECLMRLPESLGQLRSLQKLAIDSKTLTRLPESLGQLRSLQKLEIRCFRLTHLPDTLGQLRSLQKLEVCRSRLTCLTGSLKLGWWELMTISMHYTLRAFSDNLGLRGFRFLELFEICRCDGLTTDTLAQLDDLRELNFVRCIGLTALPDTLGQLDGLQKLKIASCDCLTALPDALGQLGGLRELVIEWCQGLTALPDNLGQLDGLRKLKIASCDGLTALPDALGQLDGLRELVIEWCQGLTALPNNLGQLGDLRVLEIKGCHSLIALPDNLGQLGDLRVLEIKGCHSLTALPDNLGQLGGLRELKVDWCDVLTTLPDNLGHLGDLQQLVIERCASLETLPDALGDLHALRYLEVTDCRKLKALPDTVTKLHNCVKIFERDYRKQKLLWTNLLETAIKVDRVMSGCRNKVCRMKIYQTNSG